MLFGRNERAVGPNVSGEKRRRISENRRDCRRNEHRDRVCILRTENAIAVAMDVPGDNELYVARRIVHERFERGARSRIEKRRDHQMVPKMDCRVRVDSRRDME